MPRNRDEIDAMSLGAHHILHRSCRGKAHASGIAKQTNRRSLSTQKSVKSPDSAKQNDGFCVTSNGVVKINRKHSRNSTSSWECSDSDSMHSAEIGQNGCPENRSISRGTDRTSTPKFDDNERIKESHERFNHHVTRPVKSLKKKNWADSLRVGCVNDKIKKMEEGWDSSAIKRPRERKWHRITAEIEQRIPSANNGLRTVFGLKTNWNGNSKKMSKRNRQVYQRCAKPIQDIIEWEKLFEMALSRKIRRKTRGKGKADESNVTSSVKSGRVKDEDECMKRLEVLLESKVSPRIDKVRFGTTSERIRRFFI